MIITPTFYNDDMQTNLPANYKSILKFIALGLTVILIGPFISQNFKINSQDG